MRSNFVGDPSLAIGVRRLCLIAELKEAVQVFIGVLLFMLKLPELSRAGSIVACVIRCPIAGAWSVEKIEPVGSGGGFSFILDSAAHWRV